MTALGICGDNCLYCRRYIATRSESAAELEEVKGLWVRLGLRGPDSPSKELVCFGCRPDNKCAYPEIVSCAQEKDVENCGACQKYPCQLINGAFQKSEEFRSHAAMVCTAGELDALQKAFFSKRQNLDQVHFSKNDRKR